MGRSTRGAHEEDDEAILATVSVIFQETKDAERGQGLILVSLFEPSSFLLICDGWLEDKETRELQFEIVFLAAFKAGRRLLEDQKHS